LTLTPELYPFWAKKPVLKAVEFFAETSSTTPIDVTDRKGNSDSLASNPLMGNLLAGNLVKIPLPLAVTDVAHPFTLSLITTPWKICGSL